MAKKKPGNGRSSKKARAGGSYDIEMVRDFLDHLMWELRLVHFENTNPPGTGHDELMSQLQQYQQKYPGSKALMAIMTMKTEGYSPAEIARALRVLRRVRARQMEEAMERLEALGPVFEEALACAAMSSSESPDQLPARQIDPSVLLAETGDQDEED